jgi:hypothetical protein
VPLATLAAIRSKNFVRKIILDLVAKPDLKRMGNLFQLREKIIENLLARRLDFPPIKLMKNSIRVVVYAGLALLVMVFVATKCGMPSFQDVRQRCTDDCGKRGMFGRLNAPSNPSPRQTALNYECECY